MHERCYRILGIPAGSAIDVVKEAYYQAAKKNHPDLFPEDERHTQAVRMMKINEAYLTIVSGQRNEGEKDGSAATSTVHRREPEQKNALGQLKDPAYTYYKLGFRYYTAGRKAFFDRYKPMKDRYHYMMENREILMLAISCLRLFEKSYTYFMKVAEDYPDSIWYRDTCNKMHYLERYNTIYQRICTSIASQIGAKQAEN